VVVPLAVRSAAVTVATLAALVIGRGAVITVACAPQNPQVRVFRGGTHKKPADNMAGQQTL